MADLQPQRFSVLQEGLGRLLRANAQGCRFDRYFPDCTKACNPWSLKREDHAGLCRVLYQPHVDCFAAGARHRERLCLGGNRVGKSDLAAYEIVAHTTGLYPHWWPGRRFTRPVDCWVASDSMLTTRDICQVALLGPIEGVDRRDWQGMLPAHLVYDVTRRTGGVSDCIDQIWVKHVLGEFSTIGFRSYDRGRRMFQGTSKDLVWLDEEVPEGGPQENDIYTECLLRTLDRNGLVIATLTPLRGLTRFIEQYLSTAVVGGADAEEPAAPAILGDGEGDAA